MRLGDDGPWASGYKFLWMLVMFDLPVKEPDERSAATRFRHVLLDEGFDMAQFSVYYRVLSGKEAAEAMNRRITAATPENGLVQILTITDKQYGAITTIRGKCYEPPKKIEQLSLF